MVVDRVGSFSVNYDFIKCVDFGGFRCSAIGQAIDAGNSIAALINNSK